MTSILGALGALKKWVVSEYVGCVKGYNSVLLLSCPITAGVIGSPGLLSLCSIITISLQINHHTHDGISIFLHLQTGTVCADPLLTSVRRSGYRNSDPVLPLEEASRELSITLPFGTKSIESFAEAEHYFVAPEYSAVNPLKDQATSCVQGTADDESWVCSPVVASHVVCGHFGVFKFGYPNYIVNENVPSIRLSVSRSGGGYGTVSVSYYINHITTNDSDVSATAIYTTSQKLTFEEGVVERSFLINIQDDNLVEENEVFQVVLEVPEGGGSVGPQFRTNVTIIDDDSAIFSSSKSYLVGNTTRVKAGSAYSVKIQAADAKGQVMTMGGEQFLAVVENGNNKWVSPGTPTGTQRHSLRKQVTYVMRIDMFKGLLLYTVAVIFHI